MIGQEAKRFFRKKIKGEVEFGPDSGVCFIISVGYCHAKALVLGCGRSQGGS